MSHMGRWRPLKAFKSFLVSLSLKVYYQLLVTQFTFFLGFLRLIISQVRMILSESGIVISLVGLYFKFEFLCSPNFKSPFLVWSFDNNTMLQKSLLENSDEGFSKVLENYFILFFSLRSGENLFEYSSINFQSYSLNSWEILWCIWRIFSVLSF